MFSKNSWIIVLFLLILSSSVFANEPIDSEKVKAGRFDTGKMWAFDIPPADYIYETYGFKPDQEWFDHIRLSALRIPGCTASFVSEDGLIMTNNHCSDKPRLAIQKEGEDFIKDGFYAPTLEDERHVENYWADQLIFIHDVTDEVQAEMDKGETKQQKIAKKTEKLNELKEKFESGNEGLKIEIVSLYNGSRHSIYGYKRYTDIRAVFIPEEIIGYFGGDFDNFTYPRYNLDCAFYRIYDEDGKPINTKNYFKWAKEGAKKGDALFTVGNPGKTNRLKTLRQLKYFREVSYGNLAFLFDKSYKAFDKYKNVYPEKSKTFDRIRFGIGNGQKVFTNIIKGLNDPYLLARKKDFEQRLQDAVNADPELKEKYGKVWDSIEKTKAELTGYNKKIAAYNIIDYKLIPEHFKIAKRIIQLADQLSLDEDDREEKFTSSKIDDFINSILPDDFDKITEKIKLSVFVDFILRNLGEDHAVAKETFKGKKGMEGAEYLIENSLILDKKSVDELIAEGAEAIYNSSDPFIKYILSTRDELKELQELAKEVNDAEAVYENLLGQLMYEVYGTTIPPDANFTLRLSDGVLKSFDYNGTIAPLKTTFYGLYDRFNSYNGTDPWNLPEKWQNPPAEFDLDTPFNMVTTHDAVGGSSGSPVLNKNAEVVGLSFDGNMESIVGNFIFMTETNRSVSVAAEAMIEVLNDLYGHKKLAKELVEGKLSD